MEVHEIEYLDFILAFTRRNPSHTLSTVELWELARDEIRRKKSRSLGETIVTEEMLAVPHALVWESNQVEGPMVCWDPDRSCYGLRAEKKYTAGDHITTYGGKLYTKPINGDYVAKAASDCYIDGRVGFKLKDKGRWMNESDRDRRKVNAKLGRVVRAIEDIEEDEWIFTDYGPDYERSY